MSEIIESEKEKAWDKYIKDIGLSKSLSSSKGFDAGYDSRQQEIDLLKKQNEELRELVKELSEYIKNSPYDDMIASYRKAKAVLNG